VIQRTGEKADALLPFHRRVFEVNTERLLREVEKRLSGLPEAAKAEVLDALREEIARDRRRLDFDPGATVEAERERRKDAEGLREALEATNRQPELEATIDEVLKQLGRLVSYDSCSLALADNDGLFRIIAVRGFSDPSRIVGVTFRDALSEEIRLNKWPVSLADVQQDERFLKVEGTAVIRSWAGIPLLVEGEVIGLLSLDRRRVEPFEDEDLHQAKVVAFSAAAAIRRAQLLEQVRRYATLMEQVVAVDQEVFSGSSPRAVARAIVTHGLKVGSHPGGLLMLQGARGPEVVAAVGEGLEAAEGRPAPGQLVVESTTRLAPEAAPELGRSLGVPLAPQPIYLVPLAAPGRVLGTLVLLDPNGETPDDRLMEAYCSRAGAAYLHALRNESRE
jgi:hypothetical protein